MKKFLNHLVYWTCLAILLLLHCLVIAGDWVCDKGFDALDRIKLMDGKR